jgi:large subunit ribosomal protein L29
MEAMKASKMREMTNEELEQQVRDAQKELFSLRIRQSTGQVEQPSRFGVLKKDLARARTLLRERQRASAPAQ